MVLSVRSDSDTRQEAGASQASLRESSATGISYHLQGRHAQLSERLCAVTILSPTSAAQGRSLEATTWEHSTAENTHICRTEKDVRWQVQLTHGRRTMQSEARPLGTEHSCGLIASLERQQAALSGGTTRSGAGRMPHFNPFVHGLHFAWCVYTCWASRGLHDGRTLHGTTTALDALCVCRH